MISTPPRTLAPNFEHEHGADMQVVFPLISLSLFGLRPMELKQLLRFSIVNVPPLLTPM
jgi:hypothetical protein